MKEKEVENLLKSLDEILKKEAAGENIDQESFVIEQNGQWKLEKGLKSRLGKVFGAMKERVSKVRNKQKPMEHEEVIAKLSGTEYKNPKPSDPRPGGNPKLRHLFEPASKPKKAEIPTAVEKPLGSPEDRKLTSAQAKKFGLPPAPKKAASKPAAPKKEKAPAPQVPKKEKAPAAIKKPKATKKVASVPVK